MNDSSCTSEARIECSETTPTYVAVGWHDQTGTEFGYSSNGGSTWQAKANVGSTVTDTANDNAPLGMAIDGVRTLISAPDSTPEYGVYKATSVGGAFSEVTDTPRNAAPQPLIKIKPGTTTAIVSTIGSATIITFDAGGASFVLGAANTGTVKGPGNPGDALIDDTGLGGGRLVVGHDFGSVVPIENVEFDEWTNGSGAMSVWIDNVLLTSGVSASDSSAWVAVDWEALFPGAFPVDGQLVEVKLQTIIFGDEGRLDNIAINGSDSAALKEVSLFTGSAVWTDITPASGESPARPHDLAIDIIDPNILDTVTDESSGWYSSLDGGVSWGLSEASSDKRAFLTASDTLVVGAVGGVIISQDGGSSFANKTGNLATVWGAIGIIKRVQAL